MSGPRCTTTAVKPIKAKIINRSVSFFSIGPLHMTASASVIAYFDHDANKGPNEKLTRAL